jgi:hypothetical protein
MPKYRVTSPEGQTYEVNAPDGATDDEVMAYAQRTFKMSKAAPKEAPAGKQLDILINDTPTQLGLGARGILQGLGTAAEFVTSPIRKGINSFIADSQERVNRYRAPAEREQPFQFGPISGQALADDIGLPKPRNAGERIAGDAVGAVAGGLVPIGIGNTLARVGSGAAQGVGRALASQPVSQLLSAGAGGAAGSYTRETGGGEGAQMAASIGAGLAAPLLMGVASRAGNTIAGRASRSSPLTAEQQLQVDVTINNALGGQGGAGVTLADLPAEVASSLRKDVAEAMKISDNLSPDAVRRLADYRLTGAAPTKAGLTLDVADITRQRNLAKQGVNSSDPAAQALAQTQNSNNMQLTNKLNEFGAATADDQIGGAQRVIRALDARDQGMRARIGQRYDAARATSGQSAQLDPNDFVTRANAALDQNLLGAKLPADVRNILNKPWDQVVAPQGGRAPAPQGLTVEAAEQMKTRIAQLQRSSTDPQERMALGLVRGALDETPLLPGQDIGRESINAFNTARTANRRYMKIVEATPALQAIRDGVEPDKFVNDFIIGKGKNANVMSVARLKSAVRNSPDAQAAIREQIAAYLKTQAKAGAADEIANFSQSGYNKALNNIGDRKLNLFFPKEQVEQLKALGRVASYEQVQPAGTAVNNSNTAAGLAGMIDRIAGSSLLGKIPLGRQAIGEPLQNIMISTQARNTLSAPRSLVAGPGSGTPPSSSGTMPYGISPVPLMPQQDQLSQDERERQLRQLLGQ